MPTNSNFTGLALTRSERIIVVALSYLFTAPLIYANGKKLLNYLRQTAAEARRELDEEDRVAEQRLLRERIRAAQPVAADI